MVPFNLAGKNKKKKKKKKKKRNSVFMILVSQSALEQDATEIITRKEKERTTIYGIKLWEMIHKLQLYFFSNSCNNSSRPRLHKIKKKQEEEKKRRRKKRTKNTRTRKKLFFAAAAPDQTET